MKRVLLTGGSRGIGLAIRQLLEKKGYAVCAPERSEMRLDDVESIRRFADVKFNDSFDILINCAGVNDINLVENITDDETENMIAINLKAPLELSRIIVPYMKKKRYGRIVNIGSIWGGVSKPGRTVYSMTKHGVHGLTQTLAVELAPYNILVNTVCPGFTMTELTRKNNTPSEIESISSEIPMQRMAQPEEIAELVAFLVSDNNTYITGQQIFIDGGYSIK